jgi:hypothetical protein
MNAIPCYHLTEAAQLNEYQMSNVEQGLPAFGGARGDQGISNDEV